ncbi:TPR repeat-containing protein [Sphaerospermopsis reniformis]|uniref:TPR repeat-containing protein n=1 Tax=Sphaerospermopsis reniformis TaxID=531300 RepID=A0A479ZVK6_9CYAN|nr:CHAT domain-containing protein [Sphaerospermopsis reniformis]GCL36232.1 TPR repeat-containing protein [Sphaerospermopsis reniformis]
MDEARKQAYFDLINKLLNSSRGEEPEILDDNKHLIDIDLVQTIKQIAAGMGAHGEEDNAVFLHNIADSISAMIGYPSSAITYSGLLQMLLIAVNNEEENPSLVYSILDLNQDKLNDKLPLFIKEWSKDIIEDNLIPLDIFASNISVFSNRIAAFTSGNPEINIEIAIAGYEIAQSVFNPEFFFQEWVINQNNLAIAYLNRITGDKAENVELAIAILESCLQVTNKEDLPEEWARTQNNLGCAYIKRIKENKAENIELAITALNLALEVRDKDTFFIDWVMSKNNLALAYRERLRENKSESLELAVNTCQEVLEVLTLTSFPEQWAETQENLGNAYRYRIKGDREENIELSIKCYQQALKVFTQTDFPRQWANVQNNLGLAYLEIFKEDREENIELAITSFKNALEICNKETFIEDWATTQNNLGIAYLARISDRRADNLKLAIDALQKSLEFRTQKSSPYKWAMAQMNLGICYGELVYNRDRKKNLELALVAFQESLKVRTQEEFPEDWALTHTNIGHIYNLHGYFIEAIKHSQLALVVYKELILPLDCLRTGRNLGNTAFFAGIWEIAIEGYSAAIEAVETSRSWVKSESRRQEIIEESIDIYQNIVKACINAKQIDKAFEYSERSRSQHLVDLMASANLSQSENTPPKVQELLQKYEELQQLIDAERQNHKSENTRSETRAAWQVYNEKIASLETEKQQIWEQLRREDPVLAGEIQVNPLTLSDIQQLIDHPNTVILSFYTTNTDTHIFIVRKNQISLHTCTGQGLETLQKWIEQNWLLPYINDDQKWESQTETILRELSERLQLSELIDQHFQGIEELIIEPHLLLHQIPFAGLPTGKDQEYLIDRFLIRYIPSCQILDFCHQNQIKKRPNVDINSIQYGTVEDATDDLPCARWEGEQIAKMYNIPAENRLIGSSQATPKNYRQLAEQVQILHSCHHAESCLYNPLESSLKLADGYITLGQLMSPGWRLPNLVDVFLSCCETNLGTPALTDDLITLSTGFLCAGAISVVSSLWSVNDLATALFSIFYYQQRQLGKSRPEALKQAQIQLRELRKGNLQEISNQIEEKEKELIGNRKKYTRNSVEYLQWEHEYSIHTKINRLIKQKIQPSEPEFPFAHPRYWSAFICHGLR